MVLKFKHENCWKLIIYTFSVSHNEIRFNLWRAEYVEIVFCFKTKELGNKYSQSLEAYTSRSVSGS